MVVVHTSCAKVYDRLWCVYEIAEALHTESQIGIAYSKSYLDQRDMSLVNLLRTKTESAQCSNAEDDILIRAKVAEAGGFKLLDWKIFEFRLQSLQDMLKDQDPNWQEALQAELKQAERVLLNGTFAKTDDLEEAICCQKQTRGTRVFVLGSAALLLIVVVALTLGLYFGLQAGDTSPFKPAQTTDAISPVIAPWNSTTTEIPGTSTRPEAQGREGEGNGQRSPTTTQRSSPFSVTLGILTTTQIVSSLSSQSDIDDGARRTETELVSVVLFVIIAAIALLGGSFFFWRRSRREAAFPVAAAEADDGEDESRRAEVRKRLAAMRAMVGDSAS
ncbi:unnamed protein product [Polarella glacialis]|uniref:Uncharacterized protein n=1 Tax=Polarella glacialis TaxID=89957 RepID=A0A813HPW6_POLGL|nr:unnamed protein product [Polarella glacialis]